MRAAEELCCKLTYANSHQECQLEQSKKELEQVKRLLLDAQVAAKTKLSPSEDEASCMKRLKVSEQEVKMVCVYTISCSMGRNSTSMVKINNCRTAYCDSHVPTIIVMFKVLG